MTKYDLIEVKQPYLLGYSDLLVERILPPESEVARHNPFNFLNDHDKWFQFERDCILDGKKPSQHSLVAWMKAADEQFINKMKRLGRE